VIDVTPRPARLSHEGRVVLLAFLAGLPGSVCALFMLWSGDSSGKVQWTLTVVIGAAWIGFALAVRERVVFPLQTLSNLLGALREGDFSVRGRSPRPDDALGEVMREVNTLGSTLREQRLGAMEATTLLRTVMREIAVAIFAFDEHQRLRLVNRAGERLLAAPAERLLGQTAVELEMEACLDGPHETTMQTVFPGGAGRWGVRRTRIREHGLPLELVVISDLTQALSQQELQAWQRLVRVLGHELNNSLAPIKSIAGSLYARVDQMTGDDATVKDFRRGLGVVESRADSLHRFVQSYRLLAQLPPPHFKSVQLGPLLERVVLLEQRLRVHLDTGPPVVIDADPDQLEQMFINLLRNAVDASLANGSDAVRAVWRIVDTTAVVSIEDRGAGIANTENLFVPFYTTKPMGSGVGLALAQQIARAHGGEIRLLNRDDGDGARATIRLPVAQIQAV